MKLYLLNFYLIIFLFLSSCSLKNTKTHYSPNVSQKDEEREIYLQKQILINEMLSSTKILHQISWPILKNNRDICGQQSSFSFGILYAVKKDLPKKDRKFFKKIFNKNVLPHHFKKYQVDNFPIIVSVAINSPAYDADLQEGDIVLEINNLKVTEFRKKLRKTISINPELSLKVLRNGEILEKIIKGIQVCNYNVQVIPSPAPNAFADGEKVFITLAAVKLARTKDELAFLIGHELAHNIYHFKFIKGSEANTLAINYLDTPKLTSFSSFFLVSTQSKETEADLKGVEIAFKGGFLLENVNDYWRRLSVFNPSLISSSSFVYKSNALRAIMITKKLKQLKKNIEKK